MPATLQVVLGRIIAAVVSAAIAWLVAKGIIKEDQVKPNDIPAIVAWIFGVGTTLYAIGHTWYNSKFNKKDVSSPSLLPVAQADAHYEEAKAKNASK